jgi:hypothetical protein
MAFEDRMEILMVYNEMISHYSSVFEDTWMWICKNIEKIIL